jgi:hypothetical protein
MHKYRDLIAIISGLLLFLFFLLIRGNSDISESLAITLAILSCMLLSAAFAFSSPVGRAPWRWGLWVSSSFWLFLTVVSVSYFLNHQYMWLPVIQAIMFAGTACLGAMLGWWASNKLRGAAARHG